MLSASGERAKALADCEAALAIRQRLCDAQPTLPWLRWELAGSHSALGTVQRRARHPADAVASFRRAIALVEQLPTLTPRIHYSLACCHAQLAAMATEAGSGITAEEGKAEAEKAMAMLRQAIDGGFDGIGRLRADTSLNVLGPRADFQKLVKELEAKVSKSNVNARGIGIARIGIRQFPGWPFQIPSGLTNFGAGLLMPYSSTPLNKSGIFF